MRKTLIRRQPSHLVALALVLSAGAAAAVATAERPAASAPSYSELLEKAIFTEETLGDLDAAIEIYREIIARAEADRPYVAQAQFRLGLCYLKKGKQDEAVAALQKLVADFPKQEQLVAQAQARLSELGHPAAEAGMVVRRIWEGSEVDTTGAPSPDGRYLTFVDWSTGDLAIRDLAAGENRRLTNKGSWFESIEYANHPRLSPDSKQVAYAWFNEDYFYDLRLVGIDGSNPRVLYRNEEVNYLQPAAWSPDGKHILALLSRKDRTNQIVLVSSADGSVRVLKMLDGRLAGKMSLSPDGRYVLYDIPAGEDSPERDIFLLATDGSREIPIIEHPADDRFPVWAPDGTRMVFASDRTGAMGVWVIQVADGKPQGSPQLVKPDIGKNVLMGFTRKGSLYYGHSAWANTGNVYVATLDLAAGALRVPPAPVSQRFVGSNIAPEWSPDGKYLAYVSQRGPSGRRSKVIVIRSVETGQERELPLTVTEFVTRPRWSPDAGSFLVKGSDEKNRTGLYRIDAEAGDVTSIVQVEPGAWIGWAAWSADGTAVFYQRTDLATKVQNIVRRDLESGQEKRFEIAVLPSFVDNFVLSPDGRQLAFRRSEQEPPSMTLMVMPAAGGEARDLLRVQPPEYIKGGVWERSLAWTPDGRHLLFAKGHEDDQEQTFELWRIPAEGGEPQRLGLAMANLRDLRVHPDGQRIAFTAGKFSAEVWVMENFLPQVVASR